MSNSIFHKVLEKVKTFQSKKVKNLNHNSIAILTLLINLCAHYKKNYCYPSQDWILETLKEKYKVYISKRTLNYHLRLLEDLGFIQRKRRIARAKDGTLSTKSTLYILARKAYKFIKTRIKEVWHWLRKRGDWKKKFIVLAELDRIRNLPQKARTPEQYIALIKAICSV
ncbi:MAG: helix-turn-helix domain-containing protein [Canidatus Methanoxibalbensis ujae]|nr:helix-turn-helix domain-containing protein [Candidatus Methanoxibalbensis ujae]